MPILGAEAFRYAYFGQGTGPIYLNNIFCYGYESKLISCPRGSYFGQNSYCLHYEDAGVRCTVTPECTVPDVRLANGENSFEGELQICRNGVWSKVCIPSYYYYYYRLTLARVACRTLFGSTRGIIISLMKNNNVIIYLFLVGTFYSLTSYPRLGVAVIYCSGYESNIANCYHYYTSSYCANTILTCYPRWRYAGQPMLIPGPQYGRLLVSVDNAWGTVCKDLFDVNDARVVCSELGLPASSK